MLEGKRVQAEIALWCSKNDEDPAKVISNPDHPVVQKALKRELSRTTISDDALEKCIVELRNKLSNETISAFLVYTDDVIARLIRERPVNVAELRDIVMKKGNYQINKEVYLTQFLQCICFNDCDN